MDKLQWFKFTPTDWVMGKIQRCPEITQARFMRLICLYWNKECLLSYEDAEIEIDKEHLDILISKKVLKNDNGFLVVEFLNEQLENIAETSEKRRKAVLQRWNKVKQNDTSVLQTDTSVIESDTEKSRVEKELDKKREDKNIPAFLEFSNYAKEKEPKVNIKALKNKYDAWVVNGWKNGNDRPIKNWKSALLQTLIYIEKNNTNANGMVY
jgi:hypothetical protein